MISKKGVLFGVVVDNKQISDGTIKVKIVNKRKHFKYNGYISKVKYYFVHVKSGTFTDDQLANKELLMNQVVSIIPCAPVSKRKRFVLGGLV